MCRYKDLVNPMNYEEYKDLVFSYASNGKSTGEGLIEQVKATKLNAQRIKRLDRIYLPSDVLKELVCKIHFQTKWIVITESWCGDGAQNLPLIAKLAGLNPKIQLIIVLRDENPVLMDAHLTSGSRSIPKLISVDLANESVIFEWGPRPHDIAFRARQLKNESPDISHDEFVEKIQLWYFQDKGASFEKDFISLLK